MRYKDTLFFAASATWNHKWLWLLSLLTITPLTISNEWTLTSNVIAALKSPDEYFFLLSSFVSGVSSDGITLGSFVRALANSLGAAFSFVLAVLFVVVIAFFSLWIVMNAQAIVIKSLGNYRNIPFSLEKSLTETTRYWKTVLLLNVTLLSAKVLFLSYFLLMEAASNTISKQILLWSVATLGTLGLMLLSFTMRFSLFKVILEQLSFREALQDGFALAKRRFMSSLEFSFVLFLITFFVIILMVVIMNILLPDDTFSLSLINVLLIREGWGKLIVGTLAILFVTFLSSVLLLFQYAAWIEWYRDESNTPRSYLIRWFYLLKTKLSRA